MKAPLGVVVAMLLAGRAEPVAAQAHTRVKTPAAPGEQAPPADPGQNNFGAPIMRPGPGGQRPPAPPRRPKPKFGTVSLDEISMSDPFVHPDAKTRTYYLIGSGGHLYKSPDLKAWTGPYSVIDLEGTWMDGHFVAAPEIHRIRGKYYLAGTWNDHNHLIENVPRRYNVPTNQTQLLVANSPEGPFKPLVPEFDFCLGPGDWDIIDGTLYEEDGTTYMVFVHEWTQIVDGSMAYMPLSKDLKHRTAEPTTLFRASEAAWSKEMNSIGEATFGLKMPGWVTDGPQLFRTRTGRLGMLWSSWGDRRYAQGVAYSASGSIKGPWVQEKEALTGDNSGHGMLFRTFDGTLLFVVHHAEGKGPRKPQIWTADDSGDKLLLKDRYDSRKASWVFASGCTRGAMPTKPHAPWARHRPARPRSRPRRARRSMAPRDRLCEDPVRRRTTMVDRRDFIHRTASAAGAAVLASTARSYARILGANDRIQIGQIGCSDRAFGLREMLKATADTFDRNFDLRSVCDIWSVNREKGARHAETLFGRRPATYKYSEEMLADEELDAVMVATGDHQHARILAEVARAGKDAYCEKPMANTLEDAKLARAAVRETGCIAQMGSQWLSCPYQQRVREIVRSGRLGRVTKVEQSWNFNGPRWRLPRDPDIAALREEDTDWERWLLGRPWRPFDPRAYFEFRLYEDFSGGITDQWYSHGSGLVHFYLDRFVPDDTVASGGIFAWHDGRENPDTFQCLSTFRKEEVLYSYCSSYGNGHGDHTVIRGTEGTLYSPGGEGSPRWYFVPETKSAWRSNVVFDRGPSDPKPELVTVPGREAEVPPVSQDDNMKAHTDDWLACLRSRRTPNGSIESGFAHSVAVVMATRSYREGKKLYWDREREAIVEREPVASPPR